MEPVQQWVERYEMILARLGGQPLRAVDFSDDRLAICLRALSDVDVWLEIESQLGLHPVYNVAAGTPAKVARTGQAAQDPR
jgi:hypothetical protein